MLASLSNFIAACRSVATAASMAAVGAYIDRRGLVPDDATKVLAKISQQVTIPVLLFTKIVYCKQDSSELECTSVVDMLGGLWMLLVWPIYVVSCGLLVGHFAAKLSDTPKSQKPLVLASCAFANSTGLPITLLTVIHQNFPPTTELGRVDPTLFLSMYLLTYPILQWGVGGWILSCEAEKIIPADAINISMTQITHCSDDMDEEQRKLVNELTPLASKEPIGSRSLASLVENVKQMAMSSLQPPVIGALLGIFVAAVKPLRGVFVDMVDRDDDAPLEWFFDGLNSVSIRLMRYDPMSGNSTHPILFSSLDW